MWDGNFIIKILVAGYTIYTTSSAASDGIASVSVLENLRMVDCDDKNKRLIILIVIGAVIALIIGLLANSFNKLNSDEGRYQTGYQGPVSI